MIKVGNSRIISDISKNIFKANKLRNIFSCIAIILTTVLFTTMFTIVLSMISSLQESTMRQVGGNAHGSFKYLSKEEYDKLKVHPLIKGSEYSIVLGFTENEELKKYTNEIRYGSEKQAQWTFSKPTTGTMPQKYNEIATNTITLDYLGIPHEIGQRVKLKYTINENEGIKVEDTFILSGYWEGDKVMPVGECWISEEYLLKKLGDYSLNLTRTCDVKFKNSINVEKKMMKIITDSGYGSNDIDIGVNWAYMSSTDDMDFGSVIAIAGGVLLIMFCGYLIIYNIFYISVSKDIRFYGLLKTVGTTSKQIKKIILNQCIRVSFVAIPMGLILGYLIGIKLTPICMAQLSTDIVNISSEPSIFILASIFALITVLISTRKPAKIAGKVSPIEALRNSDITLKNCKKSKKITKTKQKTGVNLITMAISNVFRNSKKALIVTISLSLCLIILNGTYSMVKGFDMDAFVSNSIVNDFVIGDVGYFNVYIGYNGQETLTEELISHLAGMREVEEIGTIRFTEYKHKIDEKLKENLIKIQNIFEEKELHEAAHNLGQYINTKDSIWSHVYGLDELALKNFKIIHGTIDYEKFKSGKYLIVSSHEYDNSKNRFYDIGDKVNLSLGEKEETFEVMAIADIKFNSSVRHSHLANPEFFIPTEKFIKNHGNTPPMIALINTTEENVSKMEGYIKNYCENINKDMDYDSKAAFIEEFKTLQNSFTIIGYSLSFIIGFIGIVNFINTVITSIISRKCEIAMLQSIGMTNKQLSRMLMGEGLIYVAITEIFALTIGSVINYIILNNIVSGIWFFKYKFTILPVILCIPLLCLIAIIIPLFAYKVMGKHSIIERLRETE